MARTRLLLAVTIPSLLGLFAFGDDTNQTDPWSFKSPRAVRAKDEYDTTVARAQAQAGDLQSAARAKLIKDLEGAMTDATKAANLDEAVKIKAAIKELKEGGGTYAPTDLERRIANTRWRYNAVNLVFGNGIYAYSDWGGNHGTWKAIAGQTIVCFGPDGKKSEECTVNPDLTYILSVSVNGNVGILPREKNK